MIDSPLTVDHQGEGDERRPVIRDDPTKSGDRREVALDAETVAMLAELREQREPLGPWLFSETAKPPTRAGCRGGGSAPGSWPGWIRSGGCTTCATGRPPGRWGEGYDVAMVAGRLGHSDGSTTLRVYAHARARRDVDLAASLGEALRSSL